jgi:hypothetical protein
MTYCFTHGLNPSHSGKECTNRCPTHDITATMENMKGGNDRIHRQKGEKRVHTAPPRSKKKVKTEQKQEE